MVDAARGSARSRSARNRVHDADCGDGIDVRASRHRRMRARIAGNDVARPARGRRPSSRSSRSGCRRATRARMYATLDGNRQAGLGNDEDFGAGPTGRRLRGHLRQPRRAVAAARDGHRATRYTHTPGRGGFSANGLEFVSMGDGARGARRRARQLVLRHARRRPRAARARDQRPSADDASTTSSRTRLDRLRGQRLRRHRRHPRQQRRLRDRAPAAAPATRSTLDVRDSTLTDCANNGLTFGSSVANGTGRRRRCAWTSPTPPSPATRGQPAHRQHLGARRPARVVEHTDLSSAGPRLVARQPRRRGPRDDGQRGDHGHGQLPRRRPARRCPDRLPRRRAWKLVGQTPPARHPVASSAPRPWTPPTRSPSRLSTARAPSLTAWSLGCARELGLVVMAGCLIAIVTFGMRTSFGLFTEPLSEARGWDRETFALAIAIQNLLWGLGQPFAGAVADRFGAGRVLAGGGRRSTRAASALMSVGTTPTTLSADRRRARRPRPLRRVVHDRDRRVRAPRAGRPALVGDGPRDGGGLDRASSCSPRSARASSPPTAGRRRCCCCRLRRARAAAGRRSRRRGAEGRRDAEPELSARDALRRAFAHPSYLLLTSGFFVCGFHIAFISRTCRPTSTTSASARASPRGRSALIGLFNVIGAYSAGHARRRVTAARLLLSGIYLGARGRLHAVPARPDRCRVRARLRGGDGPALAVDGAAHLRRLSR